MIRILILCLPVLFTVLPGCIQQENEVKPNIIFIMADDMGYTGPSSYGCTAYSTPEIDRLAAEGMKFTSAYSGCCVCAPARSTLMTGLHMGHTPVRGNTGGIALPDESITLAEVLDRAGYVCGGFGKWGLGDLETEGVPEKQGFEEFYGYYHQIHAHSYYPQYLINTGKKEYLPGNRDFEEKHRQAGGGPAVAGDPGLRNSAFLIFEHTLDFVRKNRDRPFFCYAPWTLPHTRFEIPENDPAWLEVRDKPWSSGAKGHAAYNLVLDRHVGRLMDLLEELGLEDNTLVIFCSDNGAAYRFEGELDSAYPFRGQKGNMYEGGLRVPFIAWWKGRIEGGQVCDLPVYFPDMMPTLAEISGASQYLPGEIDGVSIVPALMGRDQVRKDIMYWEYPVYDFRAGRYSGVVQQAVRGGNWKIVRNSGDNPWELYNLLEDPGETRNLASEKPGLVAELESWIRDNRTDMPEQVEPTMPEGQKFR